jgi:hypothetical protein
MASVDGGSVGQRSGSVAVLGLAAPKSGVGMNLPTSVLQHRQRCAADAVGALHPCVLVAKWALFRISQFHTKRQMPSTRSILALLRPMLAMQSLSYPAERFDREARVPDLRHVPDLVAVELHDVDVVRRHLFARWREGPPRAGVGAMKDGIGRDVAPILVSREGNEFVVAVRHEAQQASHPIAVLLQALHIDEWLGLRGKCCSRRAVGFASLPTLAGLTGDEELVRDFSDRCHVTKTPMKGNAMKRTTEARRQALAGIVASLARVKLGGAYQWILICGNRVSGHQGFGRRQECWPLWKYALHYIPSVCLCQRRWRPSLG